MSSLNSFLIEGNLTNDPVKEGNTCLFTIESQRFYSGTGLEGDKKKETNFFNIEVWNKTAELCLKTLAKGRGVRVVGRVRCTDGKNWTVVGESVDFKTKFDKKPGEVAEPPKA